MKGALLPLEAKAILSFSLSLSLSLERGKKRHRATDERREDKMSAGEIKVRLCLVKILIH